MTEIKFNNIDFAIVNEERRTIIFKGRKGKVIQHYNRYLNKSNLKIVPFEGKYLNYYGSHNKSIL